MDMKKESISYLKEDVNLNHRNSIKVNLIESIEDSAKCINHVLERVLEKLDSEHKAYIMAHKDVKMVDVFRSLSYAKEKIVCRESVMEPALYKIIKDMVNNYKEEVAKRYGSVDAIEAYNSIFKEVDVLYDLIDNEVPNSNMLKKDEVSYRLKENLISKLEELEGLCKETDEYVEKEFKNFEAVR